MRFTSRNAAGVALGRYLADRKVSADVVVGLPRGGVVVAAEVARILNLPLDVLVVRKIGHPHFREFAVGALAEDGVVVLDQDMLSTNPAAHEPLDQIITEETLRLRDYERRFHQGGKHELAGRRIVIVDDGWATGATAEAAVKSAQRSRACWVGVAAPVASSPAVERLLPLADEVFVLCNDPEFSAVGSYYDEFAQTTDAEVTMLLAVAGGGER